MEKQNNPQKEQPGRGAKGARKKRSLSRTILITLLCVLGAVMLAIGGLLLSAWSRVNAPGTFVFEHEEGEATPSEAPANASPAPASTPAQAATPGATLPPDALHENDELEPDDDLPEDADDLAGLPLSDIYPQTELNAFKLRAMELQNANKTEFTNILLVGVDRRGSQGGNADTIMIATLDKRNQRLKLTSILRDCYVPIPEVGEGRINSAAAHGGMPLLLDTINQAFDMELSKYVLVDFRMFERIVDKLGGVTVRMTEKEISAANDVIAGLNKQRGVEYLWDGFIFANPGNVLLDGKQALGYARVRKIDSDFSRTNRQFKVLSAIYAKFRSKNAVQQAALVYDLLEYVETDLNPAEVVDIAMAALSLNTNGLLHEQVPFADTYRSGSVQRKSALALDMPANAWLLHAFIYLNDDVPDEAVLYSGGPSLPPRTPSPTLPPGMLPGEEGDPLAPDATDPTGGLPAYPAATPPDAAG